MSYIILCSKNENIYEYLKRKREHFPDHYQIQIFLLPAFNSGYLRAYYYVKFDIHIHGPEICVDKSSQTTLRKIHYTTTLA
jgi:hypothetical protein